MKEEASVRHVFTFEEAANVLATAFYYLEFCAFQEGKELFSVQDIFNEVRDAAKEEMRDLLA
ncbi:MAG: hypothetical protein IPF96_10960 [Rhodobacter sp.]|nr:hypothetical protein [Rhodobacter sp.]